jgi:hypothetical protein
MSKFFRVTAWSKRYVPLYVSAHISDLIEARGFAEDLAAGKLDRMSHVSISDHNGKVILSIDCLAINKMLGVVDKMGNSDDNATVKA